MNSNLVQRLLPHRFACIGILGRMLLVAFILAGSSARAFAACLDAAAITSALAGGVSKFVFFKIINNFLRDEIDYLQWTLLSRAAVAVSFSAVMLLTVWVLIQGYRIITGRSHQPMMALVGDTAKAFLVLVIAASMAYNTSGIYLYLTDRMVTAISETVNPNGGSPYEGIDKGLAQMDLMLGVIDAISDGANAATGQVGDSEVQSAKDRAKWFTGIGVAGPSVIGGSVLLLNKIAIALFVGFGPLFIMFLMFDYTKSLFQRWLLYGIGTVFSLAILAFMVSISTKVVTSVSAAILAQYVLLTCNAWGLGIGGGGGGEGITSLAMQQGGLGLILSTMIISAPPMAAAFFQGTLGQFSGYSPFGQIGRGTGEGHHAPKAPTSVTGAENQPKQLI